MRNLIQPTLVHIGTVTKKGGQVYEIDALRFGTHYRVAIARKHGVSTAAGDFESRAAYEQWKAAARQAIRNGDNCPR